MPELPDITLYVEALAARIEGRRLLDVRVESISLLRSVDPPLAELVGRRVTGARRLGKRIVIALEGELFLVLHLMVAGRLHWRGDGEKGRGRRALARFAFESGELTLTEAGTKRRATLHAVRGEAALAAHDRGGIELAGASPEAFREALLRERHTLKRTLTDPRLFSGIGGAYADEILHRARLSPVRMSDRLDAAGIARLHAAAAAVLAEWTARLRDDAAGAFPERITAFHPAMAVHGKFGEPCPVCGTAVQRIVHADNETNYCPRCQTGGRVLADRALSRLLHDDWPRTIEELEARRAPGRKPR